MSRSPDIHIRRIDGRFLAIDNIRFWCMVSVVALHCTRVFTLGAEQNRRIMQFVATPFKFATIGFFLVSGFLLERNLATCDRWQVFLRRFRKVFAPWLLWSALFTSLLTISDLIQHRAPFLDDAPLGSALRSEVMRCLTCTALWFVPNLLFGLAILLIFRKHLESLVLGAALLALDLLYTANIYAQWFPAQHTRALFAFIFYLWLGHYAARHVAALNQLLSTLPGWLLLLLTVSAGALAFSETGLLHGLGSIDSLNTLRASNQIFSVLAVLCLAKVRRRLWPRAVDVGRHTFGIYLSHALIVSIVLTGARRLLELRSVAGYTHNQGVRLILWVAATSIAWTSGFLISRRIAASPNLSWMQGLARVPAPQPEGSGRSAIGLIPILQV